MLANTAVVCIVTFYFEHAEHFHISHFTNHLKHYITVDHIWKLLTSCTKLCYVYVIFKWTNQSCSSWKISQSTNIELRTCKHFFQWKLEKLWSFDKVRNILVEKKNRDMGSEKYILLDFAKHLSLSELQKNSQVVNVSIRFQEDESLF